MFSFNKARDFALSTYSAMINIKNQALLPDFEKDDDMKGLRDFITRVRQCSGPDAEDKIVNQELAKIRSSFKKSGIDGHTKKKSICKLIYVFLLGKQVSFGQSEALSLLSSNVLKEKQIGYLFISTLFNPKCYTSALLIQCIKSDLLSTNPRFTYLALQCVANIGNKEMASALSRKIFDLVKNKSTPDFVLQSALLCLLKLVRASADSAVYKGWSGELLTMIGQGDLGVVLNALSLLDGIIKVDPETVSIKSDIIRIAISELRRILSGVRPGLHQYQYGTVPAPWHLVSFMRLLKNFGVPEDDYSKHMLEEVLNTILDEVEEPIDSGKIRKDIKCTNVRYAVFFEAVGVITQNTNSVKLWTRAEAFAGWLLVHKTTNCRYLALEALGQLAGANFTSKPMDDIQKKAVVYLKKGTDPSIQQQAVNFLCSISNQSNVSSIVEDLLEYLKSSKSTNRASVAVQIARIAEQSIPDYAWYVGTLIKLVAAAGDVVDDKICSKIVQIVSERSDVQKLAVDAAFAAIMEPYPHESLIVLSGFILGEFGSSVNDSNATALLQFQVLKSKYARCSVETKAVALSCFLKMAHKRPALRKPVCDLFQENATSGDLEVQKRSVEYLKLLDSANNGVLSAVLRALPPSECEQRFSDGTSGNLPPKSDGDGRTDFIDAQTIFIQVPSDFKAFVTSNKGILYDDVALKITMDSSYQGASGQISVAFESKFLSVPTFSTPKLLEQDPKISIKIHHKTQKKSRRVDMNFAIECHQAFENFPKVYIEVTADKSLRIQILLNLPVFVNKFFEPVPMTDQLFIERWHVLESQSVAIDRLFQTMKSNDLSAIESLLKDTNISPLALRGTNPFNHLIGCGGLYKTTESTIGILVRLEIDASIQSFRMSVRSPDAVLAKQFAELLQAIIM